MSFNDEHSYDFSCYAGAKYGTRSLMPFKKWVRSDLLPACRGFHGDDFVPCTRSTVDGLLQGQGVFAERKKCDWNCQMFP